MSGDVRAKAAGVEELGLVRWACGLGAVVLALLLALLLVIQLSSPVALLPRLGGLARSQAEAPAPGSVLDAPVAVSDTYTITMGITLTVPVSGVLTNDVGDPPLTATLVTGSGPMTGTLRFHEDGSFAYRGDPGFAGTDRFQYQACNVLCSEPATVTLKVRYGVALPLILWNDHPLSWHEGIGSEGHTVYSMAICPDDCQVVYAGTDDGVYRSGNGGRDWAPAGLGGTTVRSIVVLPGCEEVYAGTWGSGVQGTLDGGGAWNPANTGLGSDYLYSLAADPADRQVLYAGTAGAGVYKTTSGAASWFPANLGLPGYLLVPALIVDPQDSLTVYAGTWEYGVYRSSSAGAFWVEANTGLADLYLNALALDPVQPLTLYAATNMGGIYRSPDGGNTWQVDGLPGAVYAVGTGQANEAYAGQTGPPTVYRRLWYGGWAPMGEQPPGAILVRSLVVPQGCPALLLVGSSDGAWWYGP